MKVTTSPSLSSCTVLRERKKKKKKKKKRFVPFCFKPSFRDALSTEGHISHCNRVLRLCHPEESSCSSEFGCRSLIKLVLSSLFTICYVKKLACFCEPQFGRISLNISPLHSVLETKKTSGISVRFDLSNYLSL